MDFLEKLLSFSTNTFKESPLLKKFSGLQCLRDNSAIVSIPTQFHQFLYENNILSDLEVGYNGNSDQDHIDKIINRMHKMAFLSAPYWNQTSSFPRFSELDLSRRLNENKVNLLSDILSNYSPHTTVDSNMSVKVLSIPVTEDKTNCIKEMEMVTLQKGSSEAHLSCDTFNLDKELARRKTKELQKRSRKRRRRQKKRAAKASSNTSNIDQTKCSGPSRKSLISEPEGESDILCDIVATGMQILLPSISSFLICVESAGEEESDFEVNSDLNCLAEFEMSGLFVANLAPSIPLVDCAKAQDNPPELIKFQSTLHKINQNWIEESKSLDCKPRIPIKVSFAPDNELIDIIFVEAYDRKGEWEQYARERHHFQQRIQKMEEVLSPCFSEQHRTKVLQRLGLSML